MSVEKYLVLFSVLVYLDLFKKKKSHWWKLQLEALPQIHAVKWKPDVGIFWIAFELSTIPEIHFSFLRSSRATFLYEYSSYASIICWSLLFSEKSSAFDLFEKDFIMSLYTFNIQILNIFLTWLLMVLNLNCQFYAFLHLSCLLTLLIVQDVEFEYVLITLPTK